MEIDFKEYLSENEVKDIVKQKVGEAVACYITGETDLKRIITNATYETVFRFADEKFDNGLIGFMQEKIKDIISKMTTFNIFKKPDAWDREPNSAYKHLQACIEDQFPKIKQVVESQIEPQTISNLKEDLNEKIIESVQDLFRESK